MPNMIRIIAREIGIFIFSVSIFPITFMLLLLKGDISRYGLTLIYREIINLGSHSLDSTLSFLARLLAPYIAIQAFRAYQWSKKGNTPRKWAYLYFALLIGCAGVWFASKSLDLFYFMFELGDIPGELPQFLSFGICPFTVGSSGFLPLVKVLPERFQALTFSPEKRLKYSQLFVYEPQHGDVFGVSCLYSDYFPNHRSSQQIKIT